MIKLFKVLVPILLLAIMPLVAVSADQDTEYDKVDLNPRPHMQMVLSPTMDGYFPEQTCWGDRFDITISGHTGDLLEWCYPHQNVAIEIKLWEADRDLEPTGDDEVLAAWPYFPIDGATWGIPFSHTFENVNLASHCYEVFLPLLIPTYTGEFYITLGGQCFDGLFRITAIEHVSLLFHPSAPAVTSPADGASCLEPPVTVQWSSKHGADIYQVQLDDEDTFDTPIIDEQTSSTSFEASGLDSGFTYFWHVRAHNNTCGDGSWSATRAFTTGICTGIDEMPSGILPDQYALAQNYPNPFNMSTTIQFELPQAQLVKIDVLNLLGQSVRTLMDEELSAGTWSVTWDGLDRNGDEVSSGVYLYRMQAGSFVANKKMILMK